ncbi:unnamed protein product [Fructobacillus fructosus]|nr:unnamed protein product [Fructobacillus fructosus]CAK1252152.1 unnamed protein product [Fructobacillus fructosus]
MVKNKNHTQKEINMNQSIKQLNALFDEPVFVEEGKALRLATPDAMQRLKKLAMKKGYKS